VELPFFDKYRKDNIDDLIEELENDNNNNTCMNNSGFNNSGMLESSRNNNNILNINSEREDPNNFNKRDKCKC